MFTGSDEQIAAAANKVDELGSTPTITIRRLDFGYNPDLTVLRIEVTPGNAQRSCHPTGRY